ncbi:MULTISPECIES: poly(R)-hydroxyalkanoic acid synthase subunit PhaE [unclassified Haladaptatus]|uniref:poly(R)-hydroxyalkanoic acid synthase subunit PhaE n=1 Tax=unclassified Haladaptatus TaxID=2622732 RepID=UPI0023E77030|nr:MULTISPECIES: poly(R)-hydroxyalkanoic acid synthase subunit PhaE [unclassified Haladaptatus]
MSNMSQNEMQEQWSQFVEQWNDSVARSFEKNMEAQSAFLDAWADAFEDSVPDEEQLTQGMEGYSRAYEVWMDAAERMMTRASDMAEGEDVDVTEFRDIWLQSANKAFKEAMSTSAFAAGTGQFVEAMMEMRDQADAASEDALQQWGFATRSDVMEVGERLVELERRQQRVEDKLDQLLEEN